LVGIGNLDPELREKFRITVELTGRGDYIQPSIQSIKLRNTLPALRSNDLLCLRLMEAFNQRGVRKHL
jgi:hypothetical protein